MTEAKLEGRREDGWLEGETKTTGRRDLEMGKECSEGRSQSVGSAGVLLNRGHVTHTSQNSSTSPVAL